MPKNPQLKPPLGEKLGPSGHRDVWIVGKVNHFRHQKRKGCSPERRKTEAALAKKEVHNKKSGA